MAGTARTPLAKESPQFQILVKGRVKDQQEISKAVRTIKSLRRKCEGWNSVEEIRKWRRR